MVAEGSNRVLADNDPTAHAEVIAIREACADRRLVPAARGRHLLLVRALPDVPGRDLLGRPDAVYYAATRADAAAADFDDSFIYDEIPLDPEARSLTFRLHGRSTGSTGPFAAWLAKNDRTPY